MHKKWLINWMPLMLLLVACRPEVVFVETTNEPPEAPTAVSETVVVTHVVPRVVTQVVPEEIVVEVTKAPLGSAERPIQLLFPPVVSTAVIATRGEVLSQALTDATGFHYEIGLLDSEQQLIALMCTAPMDTVGFLSAVGYVVAHQTCDVQVGHVAVHADGLTWQAGMIVSRSTSGLRSLEDLADKSWGVPDTTDIATFLFFQALLADAGVEVGEIVELAGDSSAMLAVVNGEVDFATAAYIPPILPFNERQWQYEEDSPEIWRRLGIPPRRSPIGYVLVNGEPDLGGYRVRDARAGIFDTMPTVFDETRILTLSAQIPNETVAFGAHFPLGTAREVMRALADFTEVEECKASLCSTDFYNWAGMEPAQDHFYDALRFLMETLALSESDLLMR